ncbi:hypothetical protein MCMEM_1312 [Methanococcoides methylutens MM1]|uniref:Restriction endonuclease type IV Mrr domain-containing protein n=2 Tax=Methanococcoides methylutens TaxID=2226 RepID=A0A0E3X0J4_METMT|nr:hypothetical protein MCMEM_1312 [Methanococcoides methylutens MM1]
MYWLLKKDEQEIIRENVDKLVQRLSQISGNVQVDQLFPYVGRKDRRKAVAIIDELTDEEDTIVDSFVGSGIFIYGASELGRNCLGNEWEPYAYRMANAPWRLPPIEAIKKAIDQLLKLIKIDFDFLYRTVCPCGHIHVLDSLFFDRNPLKYNQISAHKRLGNDGENITYRKQYRCPICRRTEKHFDASDAAHMETISKMNVPAKYLKIFGSPLIENSRINLSSEYTQYGNLFPHRSKIALSLLWDGISQLECEENVKLFLEDAFLSILPQAKYRDYRGKSQDLHVPPIKLREVNILYRFLRQTQKRYRGLSNYKFSSNNNVSPIHCSDYRDFMSELDSSSVDLVLTDPPWTDGNAYFEKAQLYHPWLNYSLLEDDIRLKKECVVTDAPSRREEHNMENWQKDIAEFFNEAGRILKDLKYLALFFRPIPARHWLENLNSLKLLARKAGFEPLLSIDVSSPDPSMRLQQSASYLISEDIVFLFVKLPDELKRYYYNDFDIDQLVFQVGEQIQEDVHGPFTYKNWRACLSDCFIKKGISEMNSPKMEGKISELFSRYHDEITPGLYLPKALTPFSGQLFDTPAIERMFTYVPTVISELTEGGNTFSYERFLLKLSEYVENGTKALIHEIQQIDMKGLIEVYAEPIEGGGKFRRRELPKLPNGLRNILEMDPYDFEAFVGQILDAQGFSSIALVGRAGDRGVDLVATDPEGHSTIVQCKRYIENNVSSIPVQRLHSYALTRGAQRQILITTSDFTLQAKQEAELTKTELINGKELETLIATYLPDYFN